MVTLFAHSANGKALKISAYPPIRQRLCVNIFSEASTTGRRVSEMEFGYGMYTQDALGDR